MKKAWEWDIELMRNAKPVLLSEEEQTWENAFEQADNDWTRIKLLWGSNVPGSFAPERVMLAAIQSMYNMGYDVTEAEKLIEEAVSAREREDKVTLSRLTARVYRLLNNAPKIEGHPYWDHKIYETWEDYEKAVTFKVYKPVSITYDALLEKMHAGWMAQIVGAALGTEMEGYFSDAIKETYGEINNYLRKPNTYNDDITYELAFLHVFNEKGYNITSDDIAEEWVARVPSGWSAEEIALKNIRHGIYPPASGYETNPWREWIGAQMRGAICGMVAPGNPRVAAELAWKDGIVSHHNNGVIGEVFNAILVSLAFVETDVREILRLTIDMIPKDSEYYTVVKFAWEACEKHESYMEAWKVCEERYKEYNWIHAYPNAAAQVVALYFCNNDLDTCLHDICMIGQDSDCNAAQIATVFGVMEGHKAIDKRWSEPIGDDLQTYVRGYENYSIYELAKLTTDSVLNAQCDMVKIVK